MIIQDLIQLLYNQVHNLKVKLREIRLTNKYLFCSNLKIITLNHLKNLGYPLINADLKKLIWI